MISKNIHNRNSCGFYFFCKSYEILKFVFMTMINIIT